MQQPLCALTVAGSDSGGGAGVQADLKTFAAHRVHGLSAIAALTAQHTRAVTAVHIPPVDFLRAQIDACLEDFRVGAIKLGMLATAEVIDTVADVLQLQPAIPVILDPVMVATSGARLAEPDALDALRGRLLPRADVLTPNLPEAELLLGRTIANTTDMHTAARQLLALGARAVLLKGGHLGQAGPHNTQVMDVFADASGLVEIRHTRLPLDAHGTGCTLASAIAANLCLGSSRADACQLASHYVHAALVAGYRPGLSNTVVLDHVFALRQHG